MKNSIKNLKFHSLLVVMMSLFFNITNAQTVQQQTPIPGDTTCILKEKTIGILGDTFTVIFQIAKSTNDTFQGAIFELNIDTINGIDTAIRSFSFNWQDLFPGHLNYCSRVKLVSKKTGKITYSAPVEYWNLKGKLGRFDLSLGTVNYTDDGCIAVVDINNGRPTEKDTTIFEYRTGTTGKWRSTGVKAITTGVVKGTSFSFTGYGQNQTVYWRARGSNTTGGDTIYWNGKTNAKAGPPVIDLDSLFYIGGNTGYGSYRIYSSNILTKVWAKVKNISTGVIDSIYLKTTKNNIQETFKFNFPTVGYKIRYEAILWAEDSLGKVSSEMRWFVTPDMPVPTTIKSLPPIIYAGGIKAVFSYTMPHDNKFSNVNLKLWTNSSLSGAAKSIPIATNLTQNGTFTGEEEIPLEKGKYYGYYTVDDVKGIWPNSDTFSFEVKFTAGIEKPFLVVEPVECKLFDLSGKMISESYEVNPAVNLFDSNLPKGILIAVPLKGFSPFKVFNHQEGGM